MGQRLASWRNGERAKNERGKTKDQRPKGQRAKEPIVKEPQGWQRPGPQGSSKTKW